MITVYDPETGKVVSSQSYDSAAFKRGVASLQKPAAPAPSSPSGSSSNGGTSASGASAGGSLTMADLQSALQAAAKAADPFAEQRGQYMSALQKLMTGGESAIAADPAFQNRLKGGQQALERSQAAQGFLGSGNMAQELVNYGQNAASQEYSNQYNRLAALAGVNSSSPSAAGGILAQGPGLGIQQQNANTAASSAGNSNQLALAQLAQQGEAQRANQALARQQQNLAAQQFAWNQQYQQMSQGLQAAAQGVNNLDYEYGGW